MLLSNGSSGAHSVLVMSRAGFAPRLDQTLESSPRAPSEARRAVEELALDLDLTDPVDVALLRDVQLLVSELVTNSVRHSGSDEAIRLRAWVRENGLRVEIADGGFGFEREDTPSGDDDESGRGLLILDSLTDRWGVSRDARTRVWFEIARSPQTRGHARTA
jgi:anti-sigma regulatory factor (Ser/Thr protein kinase)